MFGVQDFLLGGVAPMLAAAAAFVAVHEATRRHLQKHGDLFGAATAWSAAVVAGYIASAFAVAAHESGAASAYQAFKRPTSALDHAAVAAFMAAYPAGIAAFARAAPIANRYRQAVQGIGIILAAAIPARLLTCSLRGGKYLPTEAVRASGFAKDAWSMPQATLILGGVTLAILAAWLFWLWQPREERPILRGLLATGVLVAASLVAALTGSFSYGQALGLLAAAVGGAVAASWILKVPAGPEAAAGPILVTFGCLLTLTALYSATPIWQAVMLGTAIVFAVGRLPAFGPIARTLLVLVAAAIPLGVAIANFAATQTQESSMENCYGS